MERRIDMMTAMFGVLLLAFGLYLAYSLSSVYWYTSFTIGGTLAFASVNSFLGRETVLADIRFRKLWFAYYYLALVAWAVFIEGIGNFLFDFWYYPGFSGGEYIVHVLLIGYPFALMFGFETFVLIQRYSRNFWVTLVLATVVSGFAHELPNLFANEWVYTIPFFTHTTFGINTFVLVGWVLLILIPLQVREFLKLTTFHRQ